MRTRPKQLLYLALFLAAIGVSMPVQIMFLYGHTPLEVNAIMSKLAPLNWVIMVLAPVTAFLVYRASPWLLVTVPALCATVLYNNWFVAEVSTDYNPLAVGLGTGVFLAAVGSLLRRETRELIVMPERRWWLTPMRRRALLPVHLLVTANGPRQEFCTSTFDLSENGAFLVISSGPERAALTPLSLPVGAQCALRLNLGDNHPIRVQAEVVRIASPRGAYPAGMGLRFMGMALRDRVALLSFLKTAPAPQMQQAA